MTGSLHRNREAKIRRRSQSGFAVAALALASLLAGCGRQEEARPDEPDNQAGPSRPAPDKPAADWVLLPEPQGMVLALREPSGASIMALACPAGQKQLRVNVPTFKPIASEERLSFGSGAETEALAADIRGDPQLGGVTAEGPVPSNLPALIGGAMSASYGAQQSGPHRAVPTDMARQFAEACRNGKPPAAPLASAAGTDNPCLVQNGQRLSNPPIRAIGTEPFWGVRIEGRCVTWSDPENQPGTRIWTRYVATPQGGLWTGALDGRAFELRTRAQPGCSDGMSDNVYPMAAELLAHGELRSGCAEPM